MTLRLPSFEKAKILVVGDVMLDRYWSGAASRISPEAPVPVVKVERCEERLGGAANVALNMQTLGANVQLLGIIGQDSEGDILCEKLTAAGVTSLLQRTDQIPTTTKLRVLSQHQQLIRMDFEKNIDANFDWEHFFTVYRSALSTADVVVFSDYAKGTFTHIARCIALAREANKPLLIDPKHHDFSIYHGATLLTPNRREFETVYGICANEKELYEKGMRAIETLSLEALLITRGEEGMTLFSPFQAPQHYFSEAKEVFDVSGAGDTVMAVLAASFAAGADLSTAILLANRAAGIVVGRVGTASISATELLQTLHPFDLREKCLHDENNLLALVAAARKKGEKIVVTNGCFDILHAGHVQYLTEAKRFGDKLIVLINDDASIKKLKGETRPICTLADRMTVMAGLNAVDWIIAFSEETPLRLIKKILPDVLVKGGDYTTETVVGAKEVLSAGGEVKIVPLVPGCSTTHTVSKIVERLS